MNSISMSTKKISKTFKKKTFSLSSVFFLSLHQTTKKFLAFIKAAIDAFVISIHVVILPVMKQVKNPNVSRLHTSRGLSEINSR